MTIAASIVRRAVPRLLQTVALVGTVAALASIGGCDRSPELSEEREIETAAMTEDEFVDHMAALTVAVEDGLKGEEARDRAADLGGGRYTRDEIEAFADRLRADPVRWAELAGRIDRRIDEIRSEERIGEDRGAATDGPRGPESADSRVRDGTAGGTP